VAADQVDTIGQAAVVAVVFSLTETFQSATVLVLAEQWAPAAQGVVHKLLAQTVVTQHFQLLLLKVAVVVARGLTQAQVLLELSQQAVVEHQAVADQILAMVLIVVHAVQVDLEQPAKVIRVDLVYALT
jgi:hypothetical protein